MGQEERSRRPDAAEDEDPAPRRPLDGEVMPAQAGVCRTHRSDARRGRPAPPCLKTPHRGHPPAPSALHKRGDQPGSSLPCGIWPQQCHIFRLLKKKFFQEEL